MVRYTTTDVARQQSVEYFRLDHSSVPQQRTKQERIVSRCGQKEQRAKSTAFRGVDWVTTPWMSTTKRSRNWFFVFSVRCSLIRVEGNSKFCALSRSSFRYLTHTHTQKQPPVPPYNRHPCLLSVLVFVGKSKGLSHEIILH